MYKYWTKETEEDLKFMCELELTYDEMADILDRTKSSINSKCRKLNIKN